MVLPGSADASLAPKMGADKHAPWSHSADPRTAATTILLSFSSEQWNKVQRVEDVLASPSSHSGFGCNCLLQLVASLDGRAVKMIVDTGATVNLLHERHVNSLMTPVRVPPLPIKDVSGNTQLLNRKLSVTLEINGYPYTFDFFVTPCIPADALLGIEAIREAGWLIDPIGRSLIHKNTCAAPIAFGTVSACRCIGLCGIRIIYSSTYVEADSCVSANFGRFSPKRFLLLDSNTSSFSASSWRPNLGGCHFKNPSSSFIVQCKPGTSLDPSRQPSGVLGFFAPSLLHHHPRHPLVGKSTK